MHRNVFILATVFGGYVAVARYDLIHYVYIHNIITCGRRHGDMLLYYYSDILWLSFLAVSGVPRTIETKVRQLTVWFQSN